MRVAWLMLPLMLSIAPYTANGADARIVLYLETLERHGFSPDASGAAEFLRSLAPDESRHSQVAALIAQLADSDFERREAATDELLRMNHVPAELIAAAAESGELEVRWRAKMILNRSFGKTASLLLAALKTIAHDAPADSTETLFVALPFCRTEYMTDALHAALRASAGPNDIELLRDKLDSDSAAVRVAGTVALTKILLPGAADELYPLLKDDNDRVVLETARAIADVGDRRCLPALVRLLESGDVQMRAESAFLLQILTRQRMGLSAYAEADERTAAVQAWREWVNAHGATAELFYPIKRSHLARGDLDGRTLISTGSLDEVCELDATGKVVWKYRIDSWSAEKLVNGNVLIASYAAKKVIEVDRESNVVWEFPGVAAMTAKPLLNGNILIADFTRKRVLEVSPEKQIVWEQETPAQCFDADRLPNGNTIYGCPELIREVTPDGRIVQEWRIEGRLNGFQALDNGNILVANYGANQVYEMTRDGEVVWEFAERQPCDAFRLPDGSTLISTASRIIEIGPDKKLIRQWNAARYGSARR